MLPDSMMFEDEIVGSHSWGMVGDLRYRPVEGKASHCHHLNSMS